MRIIAGRLRGLRLASVGKGGAAAHLRPTTDRVRESIFDLLMGGSYGDPVTGARVLDLFAGTGALGLEALSRGAAHATFVDDGIKALSLIRKNIELSRAQINTKILRRNATRLGDCDNSPFDLIFVDPPYGKGLGIRALSSALAGGWLADDVLVVLEEGNAENLPGTFRQLDQRRYGDTYVTILRPAAPS
ncbi:MAG: 16S rRNA (guanine(966)-N(2))-methyltransferase RsmD [Paracoccaceae bacterium]